MARVRRDGCGSVRVREIAPALAARALAVLLAVSLAGCASGPSPSAVAGKKTIVVTYSVLGALVRDIVGDEANVVVLMPNGADPHEWQPSARDVETVMRADLLVENGLGLEAGLESTFEQAAAAGVRRFVVTDHVQVRTVGDGEGADPSDPDQAAGAKDPHVWLDPPTMRRALDALAPELSSLGIDVGTRLADEDARLDALDAELRGTLAAVPQADRLLVTGHESLGYFADRYGFTLLGSIVPGLSSAGEPSAGDLAALTRAIRAAGVPAIFVERGTSPQVAEVVGADTGVRVVELSTHVLPPDDSYFTFMRDLAALIATNLGATA
jgi:zinc/manganese transport system substrate-binding protein